MSNLAIIDKAVHLSSLRSEPRRPEQSELWGVPPQVFISTLKRIRWEEKILRKAGKDPETVRAKIAEGILARERRCLERAK